MTRIVSACLLFGLALALAAPAGAQVRSDIAADRAQLQSDRQAIVAANLPLTEEQAKAFWPAYRDYRAELQRVGDRIVELALSYAKNSEALSDSQATAMLDESLAIQKEENRIKADWVPKFRKILPTKSVTRFYQIDNKLDALVRYDVARQIPLVESAPKK